MFCYQKTMKSPTLPVDSGQWWALVRDPETKRLISEFRKTGDDSKKRSLPGVIYQATFRESEKDGVKGCWRNQSKAVLTGLCVMDIDDLENPLGKYEEWKSLDFGQLGILLVYVTPSGHGLKVVFKADLEKGNLIDNQLAMAEVLGVEVDESGKDASRMAFVSTEEDILFINEELFSYDNPLYEQKYGAQYRQGKSQATARRSKDAARAADTSDRVTTPEEAGLGEFCGVGIQRIVDAWVGDERPQKNQRHKTSLWLADQLRYLTGCDAEWIERILRDQPWVKEIIDERNEDVAQTVKSAMGYQELRMPPKRMMDALAKCGITRQMYKSTVVAAAENEASATALSHQQQGHDPLHDLPFADWEREIKLLWRYYPPLKAVCQGFCSQVHQWPAAFFATGHCGMNLMTRCTYHHYYQPAKVRRLNSDVHIIGDPATGKSFVGDIYELLMRPILEKDQEAIDQLVDFKLQTQGRTYSTKEQKKDAITRPKVVKRDHDSRTSNAEFIMDHLNAKEWVDGREMQLHLTTFDSELDNTTAMAKAGGWIDKKFFELKAFHNEKDGQQYANKDSVPVTMYIHYNQLFTGTPLALYRKVNERNFGDGLATRLAVIPLPPSNFQMVELQPESYDISNHLKVLDDFAVRLNTRHGELPIRKLIEHTYYWTKDKMEMAGFNDDHADELLIMRCSYYGIGMAVPFIDDRHKEEFERTGTYTLDKTDLRLCTLALEMQYQTQRYWFYELARMYYDNKSRDNMNRQRSSKFDECYLRLPSTFTTTQFIETFGYQEDQKEAIRKMLLRLKQQEKIVQTSDGNYKKCA